MTSLVRFENVVFKRAKCTWNIPEFEISSGERLFVQGPSGIGKSTFLGLASGLLLPSMGRVLLGGQPFSELSEGRRDIARGDHFGFIFQQFNLIDYLSPLDNILLTAKFSAQRKARARDMHGSEERAAESLLDALGLSGIGSRSTGSLSVGQQQRVAAARAFLGAPSLVLADEPTSALDADSTCLFMDELFKLATECGTSLVFVSHDNRLKSGFDTVLAVSDWLDRETA